jgi:hypothetical protein
MLLLVAILSIYQLRTIQPIATTAIMIPAQNNKVPIPSTNPAVGSSGYCEAHSSKWLSASSPVNVWFGFFSLMHWIILMLVGAVIVAAHAPSPKDTPAMAIPMIKSSFGFVIVVVSYSSP